MTTKMSNKFFGGLAAAAVGVVGIYTVRRRTRQVEPHIRPEGDPKDITTSLLELGAQVLQSNAPVTGHNIYLVGFHPMKEHSCHQMEAHHFCKQVNEDFAQCLLFDGNTKNANLTGLEYIISNKLFETLSAEERGYWHPHNFEILSGQLVAPGIPAIAEKMLMEKKINSYGKTFHTWRAKCFEGEKPYLDTLPLGPCLLAWSFNQDGEAKEGLVENRDRNMGINTEQKREERKYLSEKAKPQEGENVLAARRLKSTGKDSKDH